MKVLKYEWVQGKQYVNRIYNFLREIDDIIIPQLSKRVDIFEYALKLAEKAETIFITEENLDIAACSVYCNTHIAFISSIAVKKEYLGKHIGICMLKEVKKYVKNKECRCIRLEVFLKNLRALSFYKKGGFIVLREKEGWVEMVCDLSNY